MPRTTFQSSIHGYHFRNGDIRWSHGMMNGTQLCGGLAFGSLDHYYFRVPIPSVWDPPEEGTPIHNYIVSRQMDAHRYAIPRLITGDGRFRGDSFEASLREDQNFGVVKRMIDGGRPVPILLSSATNSLSTRSHWVVATGYESLAGSTFGCPIFSKLYLYDSNRPNIESEFHPDWASRTFKIQGSRSEYGLYAPYDAYQAMNPTAAAMSRTPSVTGLAANPFNLPPIDRTR
jgi:hypothetical protein